MQAALLKKINGVSHITKMVRLSGNENWNLKVVAFSSVNQKQRKALRCHVWVLILGRHPWGHQVLENPGALATTQLWPNQSQPLWQNGQDLPSRVTHPVGVVLRWIYPKRMSAHSWAMFVSIVKRKLWSIGQCHVLSLLCLFASEKMSDGSTSEVKAHEHDIQEIVWPC